MTVPMPALFSVYPTSSSGCEFRIVRFGPGYIGPDSTTLRLLHNVLLGQPSCFPTVAPQSQAYHFPRPAGRAGIGGGVIKVCHGLACITDTLQPNC